MSDYEYGNARLHVMKSRLLSLRDLETLAANDSLDGLMASLAKTAYRKSVESALTRAFGMQCLDDALRTDLVNTVGRIRGFYKESAGRMTTVFLRIYDIHNIKALLRGLSKNVPAGEVLAVLLPIGELGLSLLRDFAQLNNPRELVEVLASMGLPFSQPLLNVRIQAPDFETSDMELALDKWYFRNACEILRSETGMTDALSQALALEADLSNVLTVLRFARSPQGHDLLRDRFGTDHVMHLFLGPGRLSFELLVTAFRQESVASVIAALSGTYIEAALRAGLAVYTRSNRLSDIEKHLRHYRLRWMTGQIRKDPLGIGVVLGYVALKINEVNNIRWIARGINLGLKADAIRTELEVNP
jgi:V/A-type H+-transporting ATPase subunit C